MYLCVGGLHITSYCHNLVLLQSWAHMASAQPHAVEKQVWHIWHRAIAILTFCIAHVQSSTHATQLRSKLWLVFVLFKCSSHVRGHCVEWYNAESNNHWSRMSGCPAYLTYIQQRIVRDVTMVCCNALRLGQQVVLTMLSMTECLLKSQ